MGLQYPYDVKSTWHEGRFLFDDGDEYNIKEKEEGALVCMELTGNK
jgi:hypothetical protein